MSSTRADSWFIVDWLQAMAAEALQAAGTTAQMLCKESVSAFSAKLFQQMQGTQGNIFFSPLSIATCLQMVYQGAGGSTKAQCAELMGLTDLTDQDILTYFKGLISTLNMADEHSSLTLANKVWAHDNMPLLDHYRNMLSESLDADIQPDPFTNPAAVAKSVNGWVEKKTGGMIKELITADAINNLTRLVLCNAIYFKGLWLSPFKTTKREPFHLNAKEQVTVDMMRQESDMGYGETDLARFVTLRYKGKRNMSMVAVLPQVPFQLNTVEQELCKPGTIQTWFKQARRRKVNLAMPKFSFEQSHDLRQVLEAMGMTEMFSDCSANFENINGNANDLYVSSAVHKAVITVDEQGTEAAAATGMIMMTRCAMMPQPPVELTLDKPFVFCLFQRDVLCFMGRYTGP